jgi:peptidoglycan-associated lipoprotein
MNRKITLIIALLMLASFACNKKDETETASVEPPEPTVVEEPEQVQPEVEPEVHEEAEPEEAEVFDPRRYGLEDVYFDFDKADLTAETRDSLNRYATILRANPELSVLIEGHCDERGTENYNLALGERRATRVQDYLTSLGVRASRLKTISYGELRPKAMGSNEAAWAENRRAHFQLSR